MDLDEGGSRKGRNTAGGKGSEQRRRRKGLFKVNKGKL